MTDEYRIPDDEWEQRQLCSDGNCIGVIGPDGRCKECGKPAEGGPIPEEQAQDQDEPTSQDSPAEASNEVSPSEDTDEDPPAEEASAAETSDSQLDDDDWSNRRLCPDGNCIGVIGADGKCKECGRSAE